MIKSIVLQDLSHDGVLYRPSPDPSEPTLVALTEHQRIQLRSMGIIGDDVEVDENENPLSPEESAEDQPKRRGRSSGKPLDAA